MNTARRICVLCVVLIGIVQATAQYSKTSTMAYFNDSTLWGEKRVWRTVGTIAGINLGIWAFDRYALQADFARIDFSTIANNFKTGFLWDNDQFSTNLFAHPYHGSMYFNAARTNGMNFWQSIPFTVGGSAMWELFLENQPPSINDIIATPIGGMIVGEMTFRLSQVVLDGSTSGPERVGRELLGAVLSPISAVNRLIDGSMWRVYPRELRGSRSFPIVYSVGTGMRFVSEGKSLFKGGLNPYLQLNLMYGNPFDNDNSHPFDYFTVGAVMNVGGRQPFISQVNARGLLWGANFDTYDGQEMLIGLFQHFNYYDSKSPIAGSDVVPYKLAETASFGAGTIYKLQSPNKRATAIVGLHLSGIVLGGSQSDIYHVDERTYNMGSGYSTKVLSLVGIDRVGAFNLTGDFYHLFTWKGYDPNIDWAEADKYYLDAQGDISNTQMIVLSPNFSLYINKNFSVKFGGDFFWRQTFYKYYKTVVQHSYELKAGVVFQY